MNRRPHPRLFSQLAHALLDGAIIGTLIVIAFILLMGHR